MKKIVTTISALGLTFLCVHAQEGVQAEVPTATEEEVKQAEEFDSAKAFPEEEIAYKWDMKGMKGITHHMKGMKGLKGDMKKK